MIRRATACGIVLLLLTGLGRAAEEDVSRAVTAFYTAYLREVNGFIEKSPGTAKPPGPERWKPFLTPRCYAAYRRVLHTPDLDYDPLLQSTNVPEAFAVRSVRIDGDTAYVAAAYVGYVATTPPLDLRLRRIDGRWLIDAIGGLNK